MLKSYFKKKIEAGCDEAGRGALAGPVVAAAVILPLNFKNILINDSKKISKNLRDELDLIIRKNALDIGIGIVKPKEIDQINILNASILAMHKAINKLKIIPQQLLIDGNKFKKYKDIKHYCIVKGDQKFLSIASASIIAKNFRDKLMINLDKKHPFFDWKNNKGYPTSKHRNAILNNGTTLHHRKSYKLLNNQLNIDLK